MCPDRKLQWFQDRGLSEECIEKIRSIILKRWKLYAPKGQAAQKTTKSVEKTQVLSNISFKFILL